MASKTTNYGLNKHSPQDFYNVEARNENWDKIDEALAATDPTKVTAKAEPADGDGVMIADSADGGKAKRLLWSNVKAALGKLFVPLARKINGKALTEDVTLTAADIKMPDSEEDVGAAMAKRLGSRAKYLAGTSIFDYMKSEYNAGHHAGFINAINCPDIPNGEKEWGYNVFFFHGENYVAYALRSYPGIPDVGYVRFADSNGWVADWQKIVSANIPEVHELPLNIAGDINTSHYSRDQFGRVFVSIRVRPNTHWSETKTIGTMPEGFRPDWDIVVPALVQSYGNPFRAEQLFITSIGAIITQGDYSDADMIFAQLTYPAAT